MPRAGSRTARLSNPGVCGNGIARPRRSFGLRHGSSLANDGSLPTQGVLTTAFLKISISPPKRRFGNPLLPVCAPTALHQYRRTWGGKDVLARFVLFAACASLVSARTVARAERHLAPLRSREL